MMASIVGIVLVKNENLYIERVLENIIGFCDVLHLVDNGSSDGTFQILEAFKEKHPGKTTLSKISDPSRSHDVIKCYAGSNSWVFAVDGDEVYDPVRLLDFKKRIYAGEFSSQWMILGNVVNVVGLDLEKRIARGYGTPPCRSMTKLYNFSAISSWEGFCPERLHGGNPVFRPGYTNETRLFLHDQQKWEESSFRCLHLCFIRRSSVDTGGSVRANLMEIQGGTRLSRITNRITKAFRLASIPQWKENKYRRGPLLEVSTQNFFV
jgi:glycosyltransferase involved in cell wall biosynthesis